MSLSDIVSKPSFDYIGKTTDNWLIVGDRRRETGIDTLRVPDCARISAPVPP